MSSLNSLLLLFFFFFFFWFRSRETTLARRLTAVVLSDFLCWFPVGLLGLLAFSDHRVPDEVNVAVVIFVLPVNSALNPFLYTVNVILEKRRKIKEDKLLKKLKRLGGYESRRITPKTQT